MTNIQVDCPLPQIKQAVRLFKDYCTTQGMRYTPERESILKEIYTMDGHFNVENLFAKLKANNPESRIAKTSIYRSLPVFIEAGLVRESIADGGQVVYERTLGRVDHDHMKCIECGQIIEFHSPQFSQAQEQVSRQRGFKILWRTNVVYGYCRDCLGKADPQKLKEPLTHV